MHIFIRKCMRINAFRCECCTCVSLGVGMGEDVLNCAVVGLYSGWGWGWKWWCGVHATY